MIKTSTPDYGPLARIGLPSPSHHGGLSVSAALAERRTTRRISRRPLAIHTLANVLWAAFGINRRAGPFGNPGRTAASASNSQEIDVYVALEGGTYRYDALANVLTPVVTGDLRGGAATPGQRIEGKAPVQLIYVADTRRFARTVGFQEPGMHDPEVQKAYYYVDTGLIAANVYLFAAAHGLAAWLHNCDKPGVAAKLGLTEHQRVLFAQSIGHPEVQ